MKRKSKITIVIIATILFVIGLYLYNNIKKEKIVISSNAMQFDKITLQENNCDTITENNKTILEKYNGPANTIVIDKQIISGENLLINSNAFLECSNLDSIIIDKSIIDNNLKIENFEINKNYKDKKYVEYVNTQEYSEAYKKYLKLSEEEKKALAIIPDKYDISINAIYTESMQENYNISEIEETEVPESFNLMDKIKIKVENQGNSSICYAFASLTAVETNLALINDDYVDLSEYHLASLTNGNSGGGFIHSSNKYYKEKIGPIYESDWPNNSSEDIIAKRYVKETVNMPSINKSKAYTQEELKTIRKIIKKHIMQYGSLYASVYSGIRKNDNNTYVLNSKYENFTDHAVSIIGWDDNFSKENFIIGNRPTTDGAYLAVNSWGENWADNGCFWISYEDYWVESALRGVIAVEPYQENINIENVTITDIETERELFYKIEKGIKAQIEMDVNIKETINNQKQFSIKIISPNGYDIINQIPVSKNQIENNKAKILLELDTSILTTGEYTINLQYGDEELLIPFKIEIDTFDFKIKEDGSISITGYYGNDSKITIPKKFFGFSVTGIESEAFINNDLISITVYENIKEIGENIIPISVIIYGNKGDYIEQYANERGYVFIDLNNQVIEGEGWFFDSENNKLHISENSSDKQYDYLRNIIYKVELKRPIKEIFNYQFQDYDKLEEIILPETIETIGEASFYNCKNLQTIIIPEEVTKIGKEAFYSCTNLKEINIPIGVTSINDETFYKCSNLEKINIPNTLTHIGSEAFAGCTNLYELTIPSSVENIGDYAFYGCIINKVVEYGNTEVELPNIIKRAITNGDILSCGTGISVDNGSINTKESKLKINDGYGKICISISSGKLTGLKISIIVSGMIEYSDNVWTSEDVTATLYIGKGEKIINNDGDSVYKFYKNGEFEFEYINLAGENKKVIAKVDIIDKTLPSIKAESTIDAEGYTKKVTAYISDEQAGLWSQSSIGYAWSTSNIIEPTDWIMVNLPSFTDGTNEANFDIDITGLSGKYYLWIYKKAFYDMVSNGFEKEASLISDEPYYLGTEQKLNVKLNCLKEKQDGKIKYLKNIKPLSSVEKIVQNIKTNGKIKIYDGTNEISDNKEKIKTGMNIEITLNNQKIVYTIVVTGDLNRDGEAKLSDFAKLKLAIVGSEILEGIYIEAADLNGDGDVKLSDLAKMKEYLVGESSL